MWQIGTNLVTPKGKAKVIAVNEDKVTIQFEEDGSTLDISNMGAKVESNTTSHKHRIVKPKAPKTPKVPKVPKVPSSKKVEKEMDKLDILIAEAKAKKEKLATIA